MEARAPRPAGSENFSAPGGGSFTPGREARPAAADVARSINTAPSAPRAADAAPAVRSINTAGGADVAVPRRPNPDLLRGGLGVDTSPTKPADTRAQGADVVVLRADQGSDGGQQPSGDVQLPDAVQARLDGDAPTSKPRRAGRGTSAALAATIALTGAADAACSSSPESRITEAHSATCGVEALPFDWTKADGAKYIDHGQVTQDELDAAEKQNTAPWLGQKVFNAEDGTTIVACEPGNAFELDTNTHEGIAYRNRDAALAAANKVGMKIFGQTDAEIAQGKQLRQGTQASG